MLIGYARVSTVDQTPRAQLDALKEAGCERIFEETASGAKVDRPQLLAALDFMRQGDTLVVWKLDRLARSMAQLIATGAMLEERGVGLQSLTEAIDTGTVGGKLIFHIFGALAEFERSLIQERTQAGLKAAWAQGKVSGRPPKLSEDDKAAARVLLKDMSVSAVARRLNVSRTTLYRAGLVESRVGKAG